MKKTPLNVVVVSSQRSPESQQIGRAYMEAYRLKPEQFCLIPCAPVEEIPLLEYRETVEKPVMDHLKRTKLVGRVDYLLLTKGVPIRIKEGGFSVDAALMTAPLKLPFKRGLGDWHFNPYFGERKPFSHQHYGFYLACRLDGYLSLHARRLIENSLQAKPIKATILLDIDPSRDRPGYRFVNTSMREAARILRKRGFNVLLDETKEFVTGKSDLIGYYSWGSNDAQFSELRYRSFVFLPGAVGETAVSTSARTFNRTKGGQSLIADLIEIGITGVKGYVSEPYTEALCRAHLLFDNYTAGLNLAESFWTATPFLQWKDIVVGDPLCAPFKQRR